MGDYPYNFEYMNEEVLRDYFRKIDAGEHPHRAEDFLQTESLWEQAVKYFIKQQNPVHYLLLAEFPLTPDEFIFSTTKWKPWCKTLFKADAFVLDFVPLYFNVRYKDLVDRSRDLAKHMHEVLAKNNILATPTHLFFLYSRVWDAIFKNGRESTFLDYPREKCWRWNLGGDWGVLERRLTKVLPLLKCLAPVSNP